MKENIFKWMMAIAIVATPMVFTACSDDSDDPAPTPSADQKTISFEGAQLNKDNYWIGDTTGTAVTDSWGSKTWPCTYTEDIATVKMILGSGYWSGFAISACTGTEFKDSYMGADQYNCVVGKAYKGNNFLVVQQAYNGECIEFSKPVKVSGFYYTNSAVTANSILNGDAYSGDKFSESDWLKCTVKGTCQDGTSVTYDIDLASKGGYVKIWKATEGMGSTFLNIVKLEFTFSGSRTGEYGLNTPAYMCIDDLTVEAKTE